MWVSSRSILITRMTAFLRPKLVADGFGMSLYFTYANFMTSRSTTLRTTRPWSPTFRSRHTTPKHTSSLLPNSLQWRTGAKRN